jgi:hypothetical protein
LARRDAEAVRRYGPVAPIVRATRRRSFVALVAETVRAAVFLGSCGLIATGISGLVALVMNVSLVRCPPLCTSARAARNLLAAPASAGTGSH